MTDSDARLMGSLHYQVRLVCPNRLDLQRLEAWCLSLLSWFEAVLRAIKLRRVMRAIDSNQASEWATTLVTATAGVAGAKLSRYD